jgi:hypothetical protein
MANRCPVCMSEGDAPCRTPTGRTKNAPHSARVRRTDVIASRRVFSQQVKSRARGLCEAAGLGLCRVEPHYGQHAHHVLPRGRGGDDDPENGRWLCWEAHDAVHAAPAEAMARGLLRSGS